MSALLPVLTDLPSTSSGTGCSHYMKRCALQVHLDLGAPRESSFKARVGTVFHKLCEYHYSGTLKDIILPLDDMADCNVDPVQEALRVFAAYCQYFPMDEWGVVSTEELFPRAGNAHDVETMGNLIVDPFTMRLDMVISLNEAQVDAIRDRRGLDLLPGRYILDHKTTDKKDTQASVKYARHPQFTAYPACYNALFPETPVLGTIVNQVIRHKDLHEREHNGLLRSFVAFYVPGPSPKAVQAVAEYFRIKKPYLASKTPDLAACEDWGGCSHFTSGLCSRVRGDYV